MVLFNLIPFCELRMLIDQAVYVVASERLVEESIQHHYEVLLEGMVRLTLRTFSLIMLDDEVKNIQGRIRQQGIERSIFDVGIDNYCQSVMEDVIVRMQRVQFESPPANIAGYAFLGQFGPELAVALKKLCEGQFHSSRGWILSSGSHNDNLFCDSDNRILERCPQFRRRFGDNHRLLVSAKPRVDRSGLVVAETTLQKVEYSGDLLV